MGTSLLASFLARTIGVVCGNLLQNCGSTETHAREMSERCSGSYAEVPLGSLLEDLPSESEGTKGVKIGIVSKRKNDPTSGKGRIKHIGQCWELQATDNLTSESPPFNSYDGKTDPIEHVSHYI